MTNFERIRAMDEPQLAKFLEAILAHDDFDNHVRLAMEHEVCAKICPARTAHGKSGTCCPLHLNEDGTSFLWWLNSEADNWSDFLDS